MRALWASSRVWTVLSALAARGVGFLASFFLSREHGAATLALYIALVITAAAVVTPVTQLFSNSATLVGARVHSSRWLFRYLRLNLVLTALLTVPLCVLFALLHWAFASRLAEAQHVSPIWLAVVGASLMLGPLWQAVLSGVLNGMGSQASAARLTAMVGVALLPLSYGAVHAWGVRGAWGVLLCSIWAPVIALIWLMRVDAWSTLTGDDVDPGNESPWMLSRRLVLESLPSVGASVMNGAVSWLCTVKLAELAWGTTGVALLAVTNQWISLVLLPATSWSAVAFGEFAQSHANRALAGDANRLLRRWVLRNGGVTVLSGVLVFAAMPWIEAAYRLQGQGLAELFAVGAMAAVVLSVHGVLERALICWGAQPVLLVATLAAGLAQTSVTWMNIGSGLMVVQWAVLTGAMIAAGFLAVRVRNLSVSTA